MGSQITPSEEDQHQFRSGKHRNTKTSKEETQCDRKPTSDLARRFSTFPAIRDPAGNDTSKRATNRDDPETSHSGDGTDQCEQANDRSEATKAQYGQSVYWILRLSRHGHLSFKLSGLASGSGASPLE
jgi:hypothetical protein